jgi:hypothetical protein
LKRGNGNVPPRCGSQIRNRYLQSGDQVEEFGVATSGGVWVAAGALALEIAKARRAVCFDLESEADRAKLAR